MKVLLTVNGHPIELDIPALTRLIDVLREPLGLIGTKEGCGEGECGTCTVLIDGEPVNACLVPIGQCENRSITTVEGIVDRTKLGRIERAFIDRGAVQCGFCTPGMLISAHALLERNPHPTQIEIRQALAGNICRCTGYQRIVEAVQLASQNDRMEKRP